MQRVSLLSGLLLLVVAAAASEDVVRRAGAFYQRTEYEQSLHVLAEDPTPDAADFLLSGKNYFMLPTTSFGSDALGDVARKPAAG